MTERRFLPQRVRELMADFGGADFAAVGRLVSALYHFDYHERSRRVSDAWEASSDDPGAGAVVVDELQALLESANYVSVTKAELDEALERESVPPLRLDVDLDDYQEMLIYRRGERKQELAVRTWWHFRTELRTVTVDERVVIYTRIKPQSWFDEQGIDSAERNLIPGHVSLKQFKDVPRANIEMLLPSTKVRFRPIDSILVGVPAVLSGVAVLITKLLPTLGLILLAVGAWIGLTDDQPEIDQGKLIALLGGAVALGGYFGRQWTKLKNRRLSYLKLLSERLYFHTIADGPGVVHTLLATAEEQEVLEVMLAYRFLSGVDDGMTRAELDTAIETWLRATCHRDIDYDVDGAVEKLGRLGLADAGTRVRVLPLHEAVVTLHRRWDDLFQLPVPRQ